MLHIKEVIVVEGCYDKNTLSQCVDAVILETEGFGIFSDREKLALLRRCAKSRGLIVLTDSDSAGFLIRRYIRGAVDPALVKHAYIPDIPGKEKRKSAPSREGTLGVEGMDTETLLAALRRCGATEEAPGEERITKADLYSAELSGTAEAAARREKLKRRLELPRRLSANALLDVLNALMSREEFLSRAAALLQEDGGDAAQEQDPHG